MSTHRLILYQIACLLIHIPYIDIYASSIRAAVAMPVCRESKRAPVDRLYRLPTIQQTVPMAAAPTHPTTAVAVRPPRGTSGARRRCTSARGRRCGPRWRNRFVPRRIARTHARTHAQLHVYVRVRAGERAGGPRRAS